MALARRWEYSNRSRVNMPTGVVKWFKPTIGYGFIQPDEGGNDVFVHVSTVQRAGLQTNSSPAETESSPRKIW